MYLIVHNKPTARPSQYISGVFQDRNQAMLYIDSIPTDLEPQLKEFEIYCYPVYLLEADGLELTLYEDVDINAYIRNLVLQDSDDY